MNRNTRMPVADGTIFRAMENFCLRYKNIALAGPDYFWQGTAPRAKHPPFNLNTRIYSCILMRNDTGFRWRGRYNEDTDICLRALKAGWCTVLFKAFIQRKMITQTLKGGNTKEFYESEGTLPKSRMLVNMHPDVAKLAWRFKRWHHIVDYRGFKNNRLIRTDGLVLTKGVDNLGMELIATDRSPHGKRKLLKPVNGARVDPASIMAETGSDALRAYLKRCAKYARFDIERAFDMTTRSLRDPKLDPVDEWKELQRRWYGSLRKKPDYSVYSSPLYFCELWLCWIKYSRRYFTMLEDITGKMGDVRSVLDLGCGVGYTSAALKELFPNASVVGTNLKGTAQFKMASDLGRERGFAITEQYVKPADLVFASEYFEHIERPIEHLTMVLGFNKPKHLIVANSFGGEAIGHFFTYRHNDEMIPARNVGRLFNGMLRASGYKKMETGFWNNRPSVWSKPQ